MQLRILTADEVRAALPMPDAIRAMKDAFRQFSAGEADVPLRTRLTVPAVDGLTLIMPAFLRGSGDLAVKAVSVFPHNPSKDLPTIHALVVAFDAETGAPKALMHGGALTALRTGAASGAATDLLSRKDSRVAGIFGSGVQARSQLEAVASARTLERAWIYSLDHPSAEAMVAEARSLAPGVEVRLADSPAQAAEADVLCTATTSSTPVFPDAAVRPGTHINAIGGFMPEMQEIDPDTVARARVFVDSRQAALAEAGDLIQPIRQGRIDEDWIRGELGEVVSGEVPGRTGPDEITLFKSVGLAVQDAVAAGSILRRAEAEGLGRMIEL